MDAFKIILFLVLAYCYLVCFPIVTYNAFRLYRHKKSDSFMLFHILVDAPGRLIALYTNDNTNKSWGNLENFEMVAFALVFLSRFWLLYYDYRYADTIANITWQLVDPKEVDIWQRQCCGPIFFFIWIICCVISVYVRQSVERDVASFLLFSVFVVPMVCAFVTILIKVKSLSDGFNIRKELNACFMTVFISLLLYLALMLCRHVISKRNDVYVVLATFLVTTSTTTVAYLNAYFIVVAPYRKDAVDQTLLNEIGELPLDTLLSKREWFQVFMQHLVSEFSVENLLFTCEVQQFRSTLHYQKFRNVYLT
ncbi:hypothetical protein RFI_21347 [Reticulomyxa filosa]|uniref:Uncharacterized protein n=1 Tax=Reticulomyxa filosa TaxID=46433 RepID=X6MQ96_RETFI|nr:hypothetical protein RFI_21347 [Reticulomyxa filosa]|eukprot:ETO16014.1 hypothetical protein RFI_21347 [Reticulomyxa filosa]